MIGIWIISVNTLNANTTINLIAVSNPVGISNVIIITSSTTVMSNNGTTILNGVYDFDLGNLSLTLPEPQKVLVGF